MENYTKIIEKFFKETSSAKIVPIISNPSQVCVLLLL